MRTIKMTTGARVALDGDLLTMLETLYKELTAKRELVRTFEDTVREVFPGAPEIRNGYMYANDRPGFGIDIDERAAAKFPYKTPGNNPQAAGAIGRQQPLLPMLTLRVSA